MNNLPEFKLSAGGVYKLEKLDSGRYGFITKPTIVEIDDATAARCIHTEVIYYVDGTYVAEFEDPITNFRYGQPLDMEVPKDG